MPERIYTAGGRGREGDRGGLQGMSTDGRGTNNNMEVRTKFAERWYARSNRAGDHMRHHQGSGINRL